MEIHLVNNLKLFLNNTQVQTNVAEHIVEHEHKPRAYYRRENMFSPDPYYWVYVVKVVIK